MAGPRRVGSSGQFDLVGIEAADGQLISMTVRQRSTADPIEMVADILARAFLAVFLVEATTPQFTDTQRENLLPNVFPPAGESEEGVDLAYVRDGYRLRFVQEDAFFLLITREANIATAQLPGEPTRSPPLPVATSTTRPPNAGSLVSRWLPAVLTH